jgi:hypothetical protein
MNDAVIVNPQLHIMFAGISHDFDFTDVDLNFDANDNQIRQACATFLNQPVAKLNNFVIDRNLQTGDVTVRPQAIFGWC